jgi:tRNA dimethylallyltransferase
MNLQRLPAVVIIAGPTASGKSGLALELAARFGGTVINADSQQIYRDLRILSARPDAAVEARTPHRLYGFLDAGERGSVARWRALAEAEIAAAAGAGRLPLLVGGTGLYLRALQHGLARVPDIPGEIREEATALYGELGGSGFRERLAAFDAEGAARLPAGDRQRLIRAWEVVRATGVPLRQWQQRAEAAAPYRFGTILILPPRDALYAACDARFAAMAESGALDEVAALAARGLSPDLPAMKAVGVRELLAYLRGELSLAEAVAAGQRATRRYAKRQMTWFRHQTAADVVVEQQYSPALLPDVARFIGKFR